MLTDAMKADGWAEHDGGPCPVPLNSAPQLLFRDGRTWPFYLGREQTREDLADDWDWSHWDNPDDIIAYKPETPHDQ